MADADMTEGWRRQMLPKMASELAKARLGGEPIWDTQQMTKDFQVVGFLAPFIVVIRREDGLPGTLMFQHSPRFYFGWEPRDG